MTPTHLTSEPEEPPVYDIRLKGHLDRRWEDWFTGMTIRLEDNGDTILKGPIADQAALHGLLRKVRDIAMPLLSITPTETTHEHQPPGRKETQ